MTDARRDVRRVGHLRLPRRPRDRATSPSPRAWPRRCSREVDATCSRFRDDSDLSRANRAPGPLGRGRPAAGRGGRGRRARRPGDRRAGRTRCWAGRWSSSATTATSAGCADARTCRRPCRPTARRPTPGARSGSTPTARSAIPDGTALDLGATGKAWAADLVAAALDRRARRLRLVSVGGDVRVAGAGRRRLAGRASPSARTAPATTGRLDRGGLATSSTRVAAGRRARRTPPPPARPAHRAAGRRGLAHGDRHRRRPASRPTPPARRPIVLGDGARSGSRRAASPPGSSHRTARSAAPAAGRPDARRRVSAHDRRTAALVPQPRHRRSCCSCCSRRQRRAGRAVDRRPGRSRAAAVRHARTLHRNLALLSVALLVGARRHRGRRHASSTSAGGRRSCRCRRDVPAAVARASARSSLDLIVVVVLTSLLRARLRAPRLAAGAPPRRTSRGAARWSHTARASAPTRDGRRLWRTAADRWPASSRSCLAAVVLRLEPVSGAVPTPYLGREAVMTRPAGRPSDPRRDRVHPARRCSRASSDGPGAGRATASSTATCPAVDVDTLLELVTGVAGCGGAAGRRSRSRRSSRRAARRPEPTPVVVVNLSEGEPASSKDAALALTRPHLVLDGAVATARALGARELHVVLPGERRPSPRPRCGRPLAERDDGRCACASTSPSRGSSPARPRAVIELIAGRPNLPVTAWRPEAVHGHRGRPTLLSNAETWAHVGLLRARGRARPTGAAAPRPSPGPRCSPSAARRLPQVREVEYGARLRDVLPDDAAGAGLPCIGGFHGSWATWPTLATLGCRWLGCALLGVPLGRRAWSTRRDRRVPGRADQPASWTTWPARAPGAAGRASTACRRWRRRWARCRRQRRTDRVTSWPSWSSGAAPAPTRTAPSGWSARCFAAHARRGRPPTRPAARRTRRHACVGDGAWRHDPAAARRLARLPGPRAVPRAAARDRRRSTSGATRS